jgi:hypothetical protein
MFYKSESELKKYKLTPSQELLLNAFYSNIDTAIAAIRSVNPTTPLSMRSDNIWLSNDTPPNGPGSTPSSPSS